MFTLTTPFRLDLAASLRGPGGLYNMGNALGLFSGLALHVATAMSRDEGQGLHGGMAAIWDYLAGSPSAVAITLSMLIFFWSGDCYRRAWENGAQPDEALNRLGDVTSGLGALILGAGLFMIGEPLLAATAGLLHAFGKFGSALPAGVKQWLGLPPRAYRQIVLASRVPAVLLVLLTLTGPVSTDAAIGSLMLLGCYAMWFKADLMLLRGCD